MNFLTFGTMDSNDSISNRTTNNNTTPNRSTNGPTNGPTNRSINRSINRSTNGTTNNNTTPNGPTTKTPPNKSSRKNRRMAFKKNDYTDLINKLNEESYEWTQSKKRKKNQTGEYEPTNLTDLRNENLKGVLKNIESIPSQITPFSFQVGKQEIGMKVQKIELIDDSTSRMTQFIDESSDDYNFYKLRIIQIKGGIDEDRCRHFLSGFIDEIYFQEKARRVLTDADVDYTITVPEITGYGYLFKEIDGVVCFCSIFEMKRISLEGKQGYKKNSKKYLDYIKTIDNLLKSHNIHHRDFNIGNIFILGNNNAVLLDFDVATNHYNTTKARYGGSVHALIKNKKHNTKKRSLYQKKKYRNKSKKSVVSTKRKYAKKRFR